MPVYNSNTYNIITTCCRTGILFFVLIYIVATRYYPGGSDVDRFSEGFDWVHNYWCELLATNTKSGAANDARPIAIGAFVMLDIILVLCWLQASFLFPDSLLRRRLLISTGVLSSVVLGFLSSPSHDLVINISGALGLVALACTLTGLWRQQFYFCFYLGMACILLFFLNTYIYYSRHWFDALAIVQKISFAAFLYWFWIVSGIKRD